MIPQLTIAGRRATIALDAPERRNALGPDDLRALASACDRIDRDENVGVVVLTSAGTTFCAGYDLSTLRAELASGEASAAQGEFSRVVDLFERLRVPTICAMRGGAYGGGADLALACDVRIGTPQTSLTIPAARFGLTFYYGGLRRFVERLGVDATKRIFLLVETLDAAELARIGFLHEIVADDAIEERTAALCERLLANVPAAVSGLKRALNAIARGDADAAVIEDAFAESFRAPETAARLRR